MFLTLKIPSQRVDPLQYSRRLNTPSPVRFKEYIANRPTLIDQQRSRKRDLVRIVAVNLRKLHAVDLLDQRTYSIRVLPNDAQLARIFITEIREDRKSEIVLLGHREETVWLLGRDADESDAFGGKFGKVPLQATYSDIAGRTPFPAVKGYHERTA